MKAMVLRCPGEPLTFVDRPEPRATAREVLVRVSACGVCRTDLHVVDGELPYPNLPIIPGHENVGHVQAVGAGVRTLSIANLTRKDGIEFFDLVPKVGIVTETMAYPLERANEALSDLRGGRLQGAAVLVP